MRHLTYPAALPLPSTYPSLSVMSYNVLLPNSRDGWWTYKMYYPPLTEVNASVASWSSRQSLLRQKISTINADVVCLQEVSPESFEEDFVNFMRDELGYDGYELFKKGRFRPATFWKTTRCQLVDSGAVHRDRVLLTSFQLTEPPTATEDANQKEQQDASTGSGPRHGDEWRRIWHVLNCHLQAGMQAPRRLRQIEDGVKSAVKLARKLKEPEPTSPLLVVCGDFNGGGECAAVRLLEDGEVSPDFLEDGEPVSSKGKKIATSLPLTDVPAFAAAAVNDAGSGDGRRDPPPTLVVPELISLMVDPDTGCYENPRLSAAVIERLRRIYTRFATLPDLDVRVVDEAAAADGGHDGSNRVMCKADVERWLVSINKQVGRGSEFRSAAKEMGWAPPPPLPASDGSASSSCGEGNVAAGDGSKVAEKKRNGDARPPITIPDDGKLSLDAFLRVYEAELRGGKFWGIAHDLHVLGEPLPNGAGLFRARYDRMYCSNSLVPSCVVDTTSNDAACPNEIEPSDHLPVAASFVMAPDASIR